MVPFVLCPLQQQDHNSWKSLNTVVTERNTGCVVGRAGRELIYRLSYLMCMHRLETAS